jgi:glycosyltransferase involved in cell wall biosynthesis
VAADDGKVNGASLPAEHLKSLGSLRAHGKFLLGYAGSHGVSNALMSFVEAASLLRGQPVAFVFVGKGPEKQALQRRTESQQLSNVVFLPSAPKTCMPALLAQLDACFLGWPKRAFYRYGMSPNKLLDYMQAGKPVLQAAEAGNDIVAESRCGFSVPAEDSQAIADAVLRLVGLSTGERMAMGENGKRYVETHHDYRVLARKYLEIVQG